MIGKVVALRGGTASCDDRIFLETCRDVLRIDGIKISRDGIPAGATWLDEVVAKHCPPRTGRNARQPKNGSTLTSNGHLAVAH